jgi:uncharacterized membrane protein (UPF0127 family)
MYLARNDANCVFTDYDKHTYRAGVIVKMDKFNIHVLYMQNHYLSIQVWFVSGNKYIVHTVSAEEYSNMCTLNTIMDTDAVKKLLIALN